MRGHTLILLGLLALLTACTQQAGAPGGPRARSRSKVRIEAALTRAPLASATAQGAEFTRLSPDETGINFINELKDDQLKMRQVNTQVGLAAGDYDGDGDQDVFLLGINSPNALFRNDGGFKFSDVTAAACPALAGEANLDSGAVFADLTGDGQLDLYLSIKDGANQLFVNQGDGTFTEEGAKRKVDDKRAGVMAAPFDADRDGDLDLYITNYRLQPGLPSVLHGLKPARDGERAVIPAELQDEYYVDASGRPQAKPDEDAFLINDGKGNFSDATEKAGLKFIGWSFQPQACDFNNDGWTDLYVTSDFESPDRLFINNGDGTFSDKASELLRKTALYGMGADSGDIDNDGLPDLFVGDMLSRDYKRAKRQSGDMYQWRWQMTNEQPQPQMRNMLFVNRGGGWMTEIAQMADTHASEWTWACLITDLNSDGQKELCTTTGYIRDAMDVDVVNNIQAIQAARPGDNAAVERYILGQPVYKTQSFIFQASEPYKYRLAENNLGITDEAFCGGAVFADFDGDGDLDAIYNRTGEAPGVYRNDMQQGQQLLLDLRMPGANRFGVGARVWAYCGEDVLMEDLTLARGYASGFPSTMHLGLGKHEKVDRLVIRWPDGTVQEHTALAAGQRYAIEQAGGLAAWAPAEPAKLFAQTALPFEQKEAVTEPLDYELEPLLPWTEALCGTGAGAADYDGDGHLDLYLCGPAGMKGQLLRGDGKGGFAESAALEEAIPAESEEMAALWFDANGDARPDLLVTCGGNESTAGSRNYLPRLLINNGGSFSPGNLAAKPASCGAAAAGDIDGDGDLDLVLAGHVLYHRFGATAPSFVLANDGQGNFSDATASLAPGFGAGPGQITDAQFADFTGDGPADLLVSKTWGPVELWESRGGKLVKKAALTRNGWWTGLGIADFDNDGDFDALVGNAGNNTKYHPKEGAPVVLYANDFDGNGTRDLIEVKFRKDGQMLPGRGRSCSGYAIGYIPKKWPTWESFANATLEDVYGPGLAAAEKLTADDLHTSLLVNNGDGSFVQQELHGQAQWAPVFGIGVGDFNRDGLVDAYLANNTKATQCETGRWNMGYGQLLLGKPGGFGELTPAESGAVLPWDQRGVIPADFNGDGALDLAVSVSDAVPQLLAGQAAEGSSIWVTLKGKAPNTSAVGAKVTLVLSSGTRLLRAVQAGSGYLSSYSGPLCFGIPAGDKAQSVQVLWPGGSTSSSSELAGGKVVMAQE